MKYKKDAYNHVSSNQEYANNEVYKGETITLRELNPQTEMYEYREIEINQKLEWENTAKALSLTKGEEE